MTNIPSAVRHVARKIAQVAGVEASFIGRDGAIDAVLETAFDRPLRQHVIQMGMRAMVPVRVFYRMEDGNIVGENKGKFEAIEDFYTTLHVAGFAGTEPSAPPEDIAGDSYGDKEVGKEKSTRDAAGQLKLVRIRSASRGREVLGWKYGEKAVKVGDKVKFKEPCVLQWKNSKTVKVGAGMTGSISQVSSKSPMAYMAIGGHEGIELPIHAIGHVYDVMVNPKLEGKDRPGYARSIMARDITAAKGSRGLQPIGFGRPDKEAYKTPKNGPNFKGMDAPNWSMAGGGKGDAEEDMLVPPSATKGKAPTNKKGDDRTSNVAPSEPRVSLDGITQKKRILLGRR